MPFGHPAPWHCQPTPRQHDPPVTRSRAGPGQQRERLAKEITQWALANNFTGIHNDWESHDDNGVDAYYFYDFWGAVAKRLHTKGKTVGTCIETAPANVSHPWAPRTLNNDTTWHSYMFNWDFAPTDTPKSMARAIDYMDVLTNMATVMEMLSRFVALAVLLT